MGGSGAYHTFQISFLDKLTTSSRNRFGLTQLPVEDSLTLWLDVAHECVRETDRLEESLDIQGAGLGGIRG